MSEEREREKKGEKLGEACHIGENERRGRGKSISDGAEGNNGGDALFRG